MGEMDDIVLQFSPHSRIRLRNNVDPAIYGEFAVSGNEGTVEGVDEDRFGLPQILVKWDKNHWAYNGVPDCWTFPEHFELVEEYMDNSDKRQAAHDIASAFANQIASLFTEGDNIGPAPQTGDRQKTSPTAQSLIRRMSDAAAPFQAPQAAEPEPDPYDDAATAAAEKLAQSEGFILVGAERDPSGRLEPYAFGISKTDVAELAIEAHLTAVAARAHQELVLRALKTVNES